MRRAECPPTTNKCLYPTQTSLSVRRAYPLAGCGYPHIRLVWSRTTQSWLPQTTGEGHQGDPREHNCKFLARPQSAAGGERSSRSRSTRRASTAWTQAVDTGWFMLTAENDFGELEDYFVLSGASAKKRGVV